MLPREKLLAKGSHSLTDDELLAIFLRTGYKGCDVLELAKRVLAEFGSLQNIVMAQQEAFCKIKGLGVTQYIQLQACNEIVQRYLSQKLATTEVMQLSQAKIFVQSLLQQQEREIFLVLFLNNQFALIKHEEMFKGSISSAAVYPREIIKAALKYNAAAIILAHNHPSGIITPSNDDISITKEIVNACKLVEIKVLDHFIVGNGESSSFFEEGLLEI